jgi:hypothetical protein
MLLLLKFTQKREKVKCLKMNVYAFVLSRDEKCSSSALSKLVQLQKKENWLRLKIDWKSWIFKWWWVLESLIWWNFNWHKIRTGWINQELVNQSYKKLYVLRHKLKWRFLMRFSHASESKLVHSTARMSTDVIYFYKRISCWTMFKAKRN